MSKIPSFPWLSSYDPEVPHTLNHTPTSICALLDNASEAYPDNIALIFRNYRVSYAKLRKLAEVMAANLRKHGLEAGDRVSVMLPNLPQTVIAFWAVLKAGGVVVMTNPLYMETELVHHLNDAGVRHMITIDLCWKKLEPLRDRLCVEKFFVTSIADVLAFPQKWLYTYKERKDGNIPHIPFDETSVFKYASLLKGNTRMAVQVQDPKTTLALLQYTGGTTGIPKGVMLSHANLSCNIAQAIAVLYPLTKKDHILAALLPLFHVYGISTCLLVPTALACPAVLIPRYDPGELLRLIHQHKVSLFPGAPSVYLSLLQHKDLKKYDLSSLEFNISGSAPIPASAIEEFETLTNSKMVEGYGLTESSPITHLTPVAGKQIYGSIGLPLPGTEARIVDMELGMLELPPGKEGELIIKGPQVMMGYYKRPDETGNTLRNGWLYTGDIAYMDEEGFFYIVDRKKDMVIVNGFNVYPREIDEVLLSHPKVKEAVSVAILHPTRGETLKAYVVVKDGETLTTSEVLAYCRKKLANYKIPRQVEFRKSLPRAATGKVLRRALRDEEMEKFRTMSSKDILPQKDEGDRVADLNGEQN